MSTVIKSGKSGNTVTVDDSNRLFVRSFNESLQHAQSHESGLAFQVIGTATLSSGTVVALHITSNSETHELSITHIRSQIVDASGGTVFPNVSNYLRIAVGRTYSTGGTEVTPVNVNLDSANVANVTTYDSNPTLTGTATEIDRWYTKEEAEMQKFDKEGAVILGQNDTLELSYVGDQTGGTVYVRLSFVMIKH